MIVGIIEGVVLGYLVGSRVVGKGVGTDVVGSGVGITDGWRLGVELGIAEGEGVSGIQ
jgi:hypothetical protein